MKKIIISAMMLVSFSSAAQFQECDIANGQVLSCSGMANGLRASVFKDGAYYDCDIITGLAMSCNTWTQSDDVPVLKDDGAVYDCSIDNGQVTSCNGWHQGAAILDR